MSAIQKRLASLAHAAPDRFLSSERVKELLARTVRLSTGGGDVSIYVNSTWTGNLRWARNDIISSGDTTDHFIAITRTVRGARATATTNRIDDAALLDCVRWAEQLLRYVSEHADRLPPRSSERYDVMNLWSDSTAHLDAAMRADLQYKLVAPAMAARLMAAGYVEVRASGIGVANTGGLFTYVPKTRAEYSVTVRDAKGTGSGWAGMDHLDWRSIDADELSAVALDKCRRSIDPVAIEPGRYTVILEPQAVAKFMYPLIRSLDRIAAEAGRGPWANRPEHVVAPELLIGGGASADIRGGGGGRSKIGQRVLDERVTISADPADPELPFVPFDETGDPMRAVKWVEGGVLKALSYPRSYANATLNKPDPLLNSESFRMAGGPTAIPEMIASTERGLLVTRLVDVRVIDGDSLLSAGRTSDGLWLIEHGKITGPVKNFRFRESPLYAFNNLEALGEPTRVLMNEPTIVPPAKVRDFSMTSLADAV